MGEMFWKYLVRWYGLKKLGDKYLAEVGDKYLAQTTTVPGPTEQAASIDQYRRVPTWAIKLEKSVFISVENCNDIVGCHILKISLTFLNISFGDI